MNLQHLKTFYAIAKTGSFTGAAKALYLTQPAVTTHIKALETYLEVTLFERNRVSKKTTLTYEGEILLTYAERIFALIDEMETAFNEMKTLHKGGKVVIGTTAVIGIYLLPSIFRQFRSQYPEIVIDNRIGNSQRVLNMLLESKIEIAIIRKIQKFPAHLSATFLRTERLLCIAAPHHPLAQPKPLSIADLQGGLFINREAGTRTRVQIDQWLYDHQLTNFSSIDMGHIEAVKKAVEEGLGISIVPEVAVRRELEANLIKSLDIEGFDLYADYYLVHFNDRNLSKATQAFLYMLKKLKDTDPK
jgi:DNA-binding transcriptional LysR family regulator